MSERPTPRPRDPHAPSAELVLGPSGTRYPDAHELLMLERASGGPTGRRHFDAGSESGRIRVRSGALADTPAVVFASERMDEDTGWRNLEPGELVHVDRDLRVTSTIAIDHSPAHQLRLEDLLPHVAASQRQMEAGHA